MSDFANGIAGEGAKGEMAGAFGSAERDNEKGDSNEKVVNAAAINATKGCSDGERVCVSGKDMGITKAIHEGLDTGTGLIQVQTQDTQHLPTHRISPPSHRATDTKVLAKVLAKVEKVVAKAEQLEETE